MNATIHLGDVITLSKGKKASQVHERKVNGARPYIQIDEVRGIEPMLFASDPSGVEVVVNDICIVWDGANAGTVGYGIEGVIGSTVTRIRFIEAGRWDTNFVGRLLQSKFRELNDHAQARGATIPHVDKTKLESISLPRIRTDDQRRIAAILDKADSIRRKRDRALAMVDELLTSTFVEMFGHPLEPTPLHKQSTLGQQCDFFAGNSLPNGVEYTGQKNGLFLLKVSDLNLPGNEKLITSARMWAASKGSVKGGIVAPKGAIVFPKRGGAIATNKKRILGRTSVLDPNLMAVFPKSESPITVSFLRAWFELIDLTAISSGSAVPQLNKRDL